MRALSVARMGCCRSSAASTATLVWRRGMAGEREKPPQKDKSGVEQVDEHVAAALTFAVDALKASGAVGSQLLGVMGNAGRTVVGQAGNVAKSLAPETGIDVLESVRAAAKGVRGAAEIAGEVAGGAANMAGRMARQVGEEVGGIVRAMAGDVMGGAGQQEGEGYKSVAAAKQLLHEAGTSGKAVFDALHRETSQTMDETHRQARRVLHKAVAAAEDLLTAARGATDVAGKASREGVKGVAKDAAKEAAKGAAQEAAKMGTAPQSKD